jgi:hypothetical protein
MAMLETGAKRDEKVGLSDTVARFLERFIGKSRLARSVCGGRGSVRFAWRDFRQS